jgi:hypothetical protein
MTRILPLACVGWLLAVLVATPRASQVAGQNPAPARTAAHDQHRAVSLFTPSDNCMACHNNLMTQEGEDVSIGSTWRSTIMANSGRDPYFQAGVRRETIDHPAAAADIQDECAACHMPMLARTAHAAGRKADILAELPIAAHGSDDHALAADGVSCTVCHQISSDKLGTRESFNGGFVMAPTPAGGARQIYGPFDIDSGRRTIMRSVTGFEQSASMHVRQSELCATCHTLITQALGPDGRVVGSLPEQMNFQEWQHSAYLGEQRSCQSCHMPAVDGPTRISSVLGDQRDGMARHVFVGGNAFMLRILNRFRADLGVAASPAELETTTRSTLRQLEQDTARVDIDRAQLMDGMLAVDVSVRNLTGHKLPTGYPSRRSWVHVAVRDRDGRIVFESGGVNPDGSIRGNDNDADPGRFEPHYDEIHSADQVQIYESVMTDPAGAVTTGLLQATGYVKDNRLLPRGFDKATAPPEIGVYGAASADANFNGDGDRLAYLVPVTAAGPLTVDVELRYQSIGFRWAQNLARYDAPEPRRFVGYFNAIAPISSVVLARAVRSSRVP